MKSNQKPMISFNTSMINSKQLSMTFTLSKGKALLLDQHSNHNSDLSSTNLNLPLQRRPLPLQRRPLQRRPLQRRRMVVLIHTIQDMVILIHIQDLIPMHNQLLQQLQLQRQLQRRLQPQPQLQVQRHLKLQRQLEKERTTKQLYFLLTKSQIPAKQDSRNSPRSKESYQTFKILRIYVHSWHQESTAPQKSSLCA